MLIQEVWTNLTFKDLKVCNVRFKQTHLFIIIIINCDFNWLYLTYIMLFTTKNAVFNIHPFCSDFYFSLKCLLIPPEQRTMHSRTAGMCDKPQIQKTKQHTLKHREAGTLTHITPNIQHTTTKPTKFQQFKTTT